MGETTWRGITVPTPGDDLLASFRSLGADIGVITPVASVAAARTLLAAATNAGATVNAAHPAYFDIGGVFYNASEKKAQKVWVLRPFN